MKQTPVQVTDLRTGKIWRGKKLSARATPDTHVFVQRDSDGSVFKVARSFVRKVTP
jgi:hypothetical protein